MENSETSVTEVKEPSIQARFGFGQDKKALSGRAIKISAICAVLTLTGVMIFSSPNTSNEQSAGISTPETSDINRSNAGVQLESYSASEENRKLEKQKVKTVVRAVIRLPGLQKIDRNSVGEIPPGTMVKAVLLSGASNGPVKVEIREPLRIRGETFVPAGVTLWGKGQSSDDRLFVHFTKMTAKDGTTQDIEADAADFDDQTVGLRGSRVSRYATRYATAVGLNFVGGMAEGLQNREIVGTQVITKPDARNALLSGASRAALEMGNEEMQKIRNQSPVIQVDAGKEIFVMFNGSN